MKKNQWPLFGLVVVFLLPAFTSLAQQSHGHGSSSAGMKMETREVLVEGIQITFQIMDNGEHLNMLKDMKMEADIEAGTTHNVTVLITEEATRKPITDAQVSMKVVDPTGADQIKSLKYESEMQSYDAYFKMQEKGRYEFLVLVRAGDMKKTAGIYYDLK